MNNQRNDRQTERIQIENIKFALSMLLNGKWLLSNRSDSIDTRPIANRRSPRREIQVVSRKSARDEREL